MILFQSGPFLDLIPKQHLDSPLNCRRYFPLNFLYFSLQTHCMDAYYSVPKPLPSHVTFNLQSFMYEIPSHIIFYLQYNMYEITFLLIFCPYSISVTHHLLPFYFYDLLPFYSCYISMLCTLMQFYF